MQNKTVKLEGETAKGGGAGRGTAMDRTSDGKSFGVDSKSFDKSPRRTILIAH